MYEGGGEVYAELGLVGFVGGDEADELKLSTCRAGDLSLAMNSWRGGGRDLRRCHRVLLSPRSSLPSLEVSVGSMGPV